VTVGVDIVIVIDTTPHAAQPFTDALDIVRNTGRVVLAGIKGRVMPEFPIDQVLEKAIEIVGVFGIPSQAYERSIRLLSSTSLPLERLRTHVFALDDVEEAIQILAGEVPGEHAIGIVIKP
jgi:threonine dehydrogenase-like Zn-dependent dehydrogenase